MRDIRNDVGILSETIGGIGGAARTMTFAFTAPMVTLGSFAVDTASKFDGAMRNINSIVQLSEGEFASLSDEVLDFAATTRDGVLPATEALYEVFSAGITEQALAMEIWKTSTKVAEAGLSDLSATTNAVTATMSAFNLSQDEATRVGNVWTRMVQVGVGSLDDFLGNAQKILPLSSALGVSLEDMGASVAFLSQGGGGARKAETAFAMMLSNLLKPTEAMKTAFDELGVSTGTELLAKFGSVGDAIKALRDSSDELDFNAMFSKTGLEAAFRMTQNFDQLQESIGEFNDGLDTATMGAWEQQAKSFDFQLDLMKSALGGLAVEIGQAIMPLITPLIVGFTGILQTVRDVNPQLLELGVIFVGVVAAAAPLIWLLTSLLNPIGLLAGGVAALSVAFATNFGGIRDTVTAFVDDILGTTGLGALKDGIDAFMSTLFPEEAKPKEWFSPLAVNLSDIIRINPQNESISLWSFFEDEGFIEKFSWDEFQQMARDAGWEGGAINPGDVLELILPAGAGGAAMPDAIDRWLGTNTQAADALDRFMAVNEVAPEQTSIFSRLGDAISNAWPFIQTALDSMWSNFKVWVDETAIPAIDDAGSNVINSIAGWFSGTKNKGGKTPVYTALQALLSGDIGKAVSEVGNIFTENFPQVSASLNNFIKNFGSWFVNEGVPTVARSIGMFAGKLVVLLNSAVSSAFSFLTGQGAAPGATAGDLAKGIQSSVLSPLSAGFQDALAQAGIDPGSTDSLFTNIEGILLAGLAAWVIAPAFATTFISKIAGSIMTKLALGTAFSKVGHAVMGAIGTAISNSMAGGLLGDLWLAGAIKMETLKASIGSVFSKAFTAFAGTVTSATTWVATTATSIWGSIAPAIIAAASGAGVIALGALSVIAPIVALTLLVSEDARNEAHRAIRSLFGDEAVDTLEAGFTDWLEDAIARVATAFGREDIAVAATGDTTWAEAEGFAAAEAFEGGWSARFAPGAAEFEYTPATALGLMSGGAMGAAVRKVGQDTGKTFIDGINDVIVGGATMDMSEWRTTEISGIDTSSFKDKLIEDVNATPIDPAEFTQFSETWSSGINGAMAAGEFDGAALVEKLITPLATGFTDNFGTEAPATLAWVGFTNKIKTEGDLVELAFLDIDTAIATMKLVAQTDMPLIQTAITTAMSGIRASISAAEAVAKSLAGTLGALDGSTVTLTTKVEGGSVNGSHAGGLDSVPYDGYIAELHKGERVLTAEEADMIVRRAVVESSSDKAGGDTFNDVRFYVDGADFDAIVKEARRRGYPIDKRK